MNQIRERAGNQYSYWIDRSGSNTFGKRACNNNMIKSRRGLKQSIPTGSIDLVVLLGSGSNNMNQIRERGLKPKVFLDRSSGSNTFGKRHDVITMNQIRERAWNQKYSYWIVDLVAILLKRFDNRIKSANELEKKYSYWTDRSGSNTFGKQHDE
jgi:hypothetical protein